MPYTRIERRQNTMKSTGRVQSPASFFRWIMPPPGPEIFSCAASKVNQDNLYAEGLPPHAGRARIPQQAACLPAGGAGGLRRTRSRGAGTKMPFIYPIRVLTRAILRFGSSTNSAWTLGAYHVSGVNHGSMTSTPPGVRWCAMHCTARVRLSSVLTYPSGCEF